MRGKYRSKAADITAIKEKLSIAAKAAEIPSNPLSQACLGYFAADVLRLIADHSKMERALHNLAKDRIPSHARH